MSPTALVVDDERDILLATRLLLQSAGYDVLAAGSGEKGYLDDLPVIVLFAHASRGTIHRSIELGARREAQRLSWGRESARSPD